MPGSLGEYSKQSAEVIPAGRWGIDWSNDLASGESVSTCTATVTNATGTIVTTLTSGSVNISGTKTTVKFQSGTDGETYTVQMVATTDADGTYHGEFAVRVQDIP